MAHLIKLDNYISRYQFDIFRYPSQFTRQKKERWHNIKTEWENYQQDLHFPRLEIEREEWLLQEKRNNKFLSQLFYRLKRYYSGKVQEKNTELIYDNKKFKAKSLEELKNNFYDDLFKSQLRWASSSLLEESIINPKYKYDERLKFFIQQLPDNYLVMYYPVFCIKQAPLEVEVLLLSPTEITCISILEGKESSIFETSSERFWIEHINGGQKRRVSPMLSINRMTSVVKSILNNQLSFPIKKVVLTFDSLIDNKVTGLQVEIVDHRNLTLWHEKMKKNPSPIKTVQLQVARALLEHCETIASRRQELKEQQED